MPVAAIVALAAVLGLLAWGRRGAQSPPPPPPPPSVGQVPQQVTDVPPGPIGQVIGLGSLLEELSFRELYWWRTCGHRIEEGPGTLRVTEEHEVPTLVLGAEFFSQERGVALGQLRGALAEIAKAASLS